jgi:hypothetical protein
LQARPRSTTGSSKAAPYFGSLHEAYAQARSEAPRAVDPTWYAFRGYVASAGHSGGGHLAWERIGYRFQRLRLSFREQHRPFDDHKAAFAMGFGLGLVDSGFLSMNDGEELMEELLPTPGPRQAIRSLRFWLINGLAVTAVVAAVILLENRRPSYPELTAPLIVADPSAPSRPSELPPPAPVVPSVRTVNQAAASGVVSISEALQQIRRLAPSAAVEMAIDLYRRIAPRERVVLLDGLASLPASVSAPVLRAALADSNETVLERALGALVARGDAGSIEPILALLQRPGTSVRCLATESLGVLMGKDRAFLLLPLLRDKDPAVKACGRKALTRIVGKDYGPEPRRWSDKLRRFSRVDKGTVHDSRGAND